MSFFWRCGSNAADTTARNSNQQPQTPNEKKQSDSSMTKSSSIRSESLSGAEEHPDLQQLRMLTAQASIHSIIGTDGHGLARPLSFLNNYEKIDLRSHSDATVTTATVKHVDNENQLSDSFYSLPSSAASISYVSSTHETQSAGNAVSALLSDSPRHSIKSLTKQEPSTGKSSKPSLSRESANPNKSVGHDDTKTKIETQCKKDTTDGKIVKDKGLSKNKHNDSAWGSIRSFFLNRDADDEKEDDYDDYLKGAEIVEDDGDDEMDSLSDVSDVTPPTRESTGSSKELQLSAPRQESQSLQLGSQSAERVAVKERPSSVTERKSLSSKRDNSLNEDRVPSPKSKEKQMQSRVHDPTNVLVSKKESETNSTKIIRNEVSSKRDKAHSGKISEKTGKAVLEKRKSSKEGNSSKEKGGIVRKISSGIGSFFNSLPLVPSPSIEKQASLSNERIMDPTVSRSFSAGGSSYCANASAVISFNHSPLMTPNSSFSQSNIKRGKNVSFQVQEFVPGSLSEEKALHLTMLISTQESRYGFNMFESMTSVDKPQIERLMAQGNSFEDAVLHIFELRYGGNQGDEITIQGNTDHVMDAMFFNQAQQQQSVPIAAPVVAAVPPKSILTSGSTGNTGLNANANTNFLAPIPSRPSPRHSTQHTPSPTPPNSVMVASGLKSALVPPPLAIPPLQLQSAVLPSPRMLHSTPSPRPGQQRTVTFAPNESDSQKASPQNQLQQKLQHAMKQSPRSVTQNQTSMYVPSPTNVIQMTTQNANNNALNNNLVVRSLPSPRNHNPHQSLSRQNSIHTMSNLAMQQVHQPYEPMSGNAIVSVPQLQHMPSQQMHTQPMPTMLVAPMHHLQQVPVHGMVMMHSAEQQGYYHTSQPQMQQMHHSNGLVSMYLPHTANISPRNSMADMSRSYSQSINMQSQPQQIVQSMPHQSTMRVPAAPPLMQQPMMITMHGVPPNNLIYYQPTPQY